MGMVVRHSAHQWNKLLETCCMKYEIFVWCNKSIYISIWRNSAHYETRNICFLKYILWNLLIVLCEEMLCNFRHCCHIFCQFKWKDYNKLHEIYFFSVHWAANMLHTICFIGVHRTLHAWVLYKWTMLLLTSQCEFYRLNTSIVPSKSKHIFRV